MKYFREAFAVMIFALWAYMVVRNPHEPLIVGAMISIIGGSVVSYFYGSTKTGAETATKNADAVTSAVRGNSSDPQPVTVTNDLTHPVPVETK